MPPRDSDLITVCAACRRASCWHGEFMCDDGLGADIVRVPVGVLRALAKEHPSWWDICPSDGVAYRLCGCREVT